MNAEHDFQVNLNAEHEKFNQLHRKIDHLLINQGAAPGDPENPDGTDGRPGQKNRVRPGKSSTDPRSGASFFPRYAYPGSVTAGAAIQSKCDLVPVMIHARGPGISGSGKPAQAHFSPANASFTSSSCLFDSFSGIFTMALTHQVPAAV